jgi:hypothetical protein
MNLFEQRSVVNLSTVHAGINCIDVFGVHTTTADNEYPCIKSSIFVLGQHLLGCVSLQAHLLVSNCSCNR